ncbi:MAG: dihydrolipoamide acetyltransferase [Silicimonas sp.]|nr:dihydrolipoamide acetyltransferase [Silicimonas sp.]
MPALGMAQETGKLLTWLKNPGDAVSVGDVLFEVETDKSVSEVEAQSDGFLTDVIAAAGDDVPVGQKIAMISETAAGSGSVPASKSEPDLAPEPEVVSEPPKQVPLPAKDASRPAAPTGIGGRILASPKARRLAREQGLDLARLAEAGHAQPFHAADIDTLAAMGQRADITIGSSRSFVTASCDSAAFDAVLAQMKEDAGIVLEPHALVAGFAAAALRATLEDTETRIVIALVSAADRAPFLYADPDRTRPTRPRLAEDDAKPSLFLRDMTGTRITGVSLATEDAPAITLGGGDGRDFTISLSFGATLQSAAALDMLDAFAARLEAPLEHLV